MYTHGLSLCTIMKNEEENLPEFLELHRKLVDEMVIVDTGSEDRSVEIAEAAGVKVLHHPMNNDFSGPRNFGLSNCKYSWIIQLDLDERIDTRDHYLIRNAINNIDGIVGFLLNKRSYMNTENIGGFQYDDGSYPKRSKGFKGWSNEPNHLLFINHPGVKYQGCVHETVGRTLASIGPLYDLKVPIHHYGRYDMSKKEERYCRLAIERAEELQDADAWFTVGSHYDWKQESDKARESFLKALKIDPGHERSYFGLGLSCFKLGILEEAAENFEIYVTKNPGSEMLVWKHLISIYGIKDVKKAERTFLRAIKAIEKNTLAYIALGGVYFEHDQFAESLKYFNYSLKIDPENELALAFKKRTEELLAPYMKNEGAEQHIG